MFLKKLIFHFTNTIKIMVLKLIQFPWDKMHGERQGEIKKKIVPPNSTKRKNPNKSFIVRALKT